MSARTFAIRFFYFFITTITATVATAQEHGFPYGTTVTLNDLTKNKFELDTTASAIVLNEFGEAYFESGTGLLIVTIHKLVKVLDKEGLSEGNFTLYLRKSGSQQDELHSIKGVTHYIKNGEKKSMELDKKSIFYEKNASYDLVKFTLPNVEVGAIVEVKYVLSTPFRLNYWPWEFQSEIPKLYSEFWANIPANYLYNVSLRGYLKLDKNESELVKECFRMGGVSDCSRMKFAMRNIPAFREEKYMTAKSNFLSAISFELSEVKYFEGGGRKITESWEDVYKRLFDHDDFGVQIKKARGVFKSKVKDITNGISDPKEKAKKIYAWIQSYYEWDGHFGEYTNKGVKEAFENKKGNVSEINLSLLGALQAADLIAYPVILSTRENGLTTSLYPVLSEFNYVIVQFRAGDEYILLDATDSFMPFGMIPERCLNGSGRLLIEDVALQVDLVPSMKSRRVSNLALKLDDAGELSGTLQVKYFGYEAVNKRKEIKSFSNNAAYIKSISDRWKVREIRNHKIEGLEDLESALVEETEIDFNSHDASSAQRIYLNPFIVGLWNSNPFKASERKYPVDFGVAMEEIILLSLEYPAGFKLDEIPKNVALVLPNKGGNFKFSFNDLANKINILYSLTLAKPVYEASEYFVLKDLFERMLQLKQTDLVFIKL